MRESSTYQLILEEGALAALHDILLDQGQIRFGPASEETQTHLQGITDLERLRRMTITMLSARSWDELLHTE